MGHERDIVEKGFEQDRLDYWAMRDELLAKYTGKWVAVHKGRVIAVADEPLSIMEQALAEDGYAYTNKVGDEDKIVIRQRRVSFPMTIVIHPRLFRAWQPCSITFRKQRVKLLRMRSPTQAPM